MREIEGIDHTGADTFSISEQGIADTGRGMEELLSALPEVIAGKGRVALVEGAAGMGRSTLLDRLAEVGRGQGMTVLRAQCGPHERDFTFGLTRQLFRAVSPETRVRAAPSAGWMFGVFEGLFEQVALLARQSPFLMVVDDFHHADRESAQWVDFLARRINEVPVFLALASDPCVPSTHGGLETELALRPGSRAVALEPLTVPMVEQRVRTVLGRTADAVFVQECHAMSGGNPKLLSLLLREFARQAIAPVAERLPRATEAASPLLLDTLLTWLERYGEEVGAVARVFALLGEDDTPGLLQQLTGLSDRAVLSALTVLERIGLVRHDGRRGFVHVLGRQAVVSDLSPAERSAVLGRAALALHARQAPHDRVARLIVAAGHGEGDGAGDGTGGGGGGRGEAWQVDVLRSAASAASASGALETAVGYLRHAVAIAGSEAQRAELLVEVGVLEASVDIPSSVRHLDAARGLIDDPERRLRCLPLLAQGLFQCGLAEAAVELLDELAAELPPGETDALYRITGQRAMSMLAVGIGEGGSTPWTAGGRGPCAGGASATGGGPAGGVGPCGRPLELVSGETPGERVFLAALGLRTSMELGGADKAARLAVRALRHLDAEHEPAWAAALAVKVLRHADRLEAAGRAVDSFTACDLGAQPRTMRAVLLAEAALVRHRLGDLPAAVFHAEEALRLLPEPHLYSGFVAAAAMTVLFDRGGADAARDVERRFRNSPKNWLWPYFLVARAQVREADGQLRAALHDLAECGTLLARYGGDNPARVRWRSPAALLHHRLGQDEEARRLADEETALARRWGAPLVTARALRTVAMVGEPSRRAALLAESVAALDGSADRLELARSLTALGTALHEDGRTAEGRQVLRRALGIAQVASAQYLAEQAYQELLSTGARPRRFSQVGQHALTASQRRVADLAARGLSNEEIASRLYIAQRTVEFHLTHVYRKLGIRGRTELARTLDGSARTA
ncbi:LuxR C-terminal-related transcriptional regulator [Streptomyces sp. NPDC050600]|uniref:LuxR C-terminal-related transcriptional regulator n=1 Tax=Streptomyces sp. NPDC050600 TaxID=3157213 RepID=UPI003424C39A